MAVFSVVPIDVFFVAVELYFLLYADFAKGGKHDVLLLGRKGRCTAATFVVGVAPELDGITDRY